MTGSTLRRLQVLAAEVRDGDPRWRATKEANLAGCLSEFKFNTARNDVTARRLIDEL
jgi:hypothetical protein